MKTQETKLVLPSELTNYLQVDREGLIYMSPSENGFSLWHLCGAVSSEETGELLKLRKGKD